MVTKHGTYIDAFAGPQEEKIDSDNWSSKLIVQLKPPWLRHIYLFESEADQVERIRAMLKTQPKTPLGKRYRDIRIVAGDVNTTLPPFLEQHPLRSTEASFCLLDQRTFECNWSTVEAVARHKRRGTKIELFYFLANHWLARSLAATKNVEKLGAWWGDSTWERLRGVSSWDRAVLMADRLREKFGYESVVPWAIYNKLGGSRIMYFMIHATDHPDAPGLMARAYGKAVEPLEPQEELQLMIGTLSNG
jgi:three-Cys-motif partner protein